MRRAYPGTQTGARGALPERRSIRLSGYDYRSAGAYFVTICTHRRALLFDHSPFAEVAREQWAVSASLRAGIALDAFVVMPNHVHGVVWLVPTAATPVPVGSVGAQRAAPLRGAPGARPRVAAGSLGAFVRAYKAAVARAINRLRRTAAAPVWQRNYYEHVVRDQPDLDRIRRYVADNPRRWAFDRENPGGHPDRYEAEFWETYA